MKFGSKDIPFVYKGDKLVYPNPIKDGLLLWYDFRGMTNKSKDKDIAKDLSGNGNHGQLQNFHYIASEKPQGNGSELYLNTPLIVTDPTLAIYNGVNPPVGGVFNNYNSQTKGMVTNRIDIPATANTLLVMLKLYSKTEDQRYLDRAKLIADYIASTMRTVSFYGSEFQVVPNRNLYADGNWNVLLGEINTRTQYQALWGFSELLYITGEYGDLAYQLMQTVGLFYNNIKGRVTDGELSPFMKGATYDTMIVDTDTNRAGFVWNRFNHSNADVLVKSISAYLKAMGEGEVEDPQGNTFDPQAILDDFAYHIKASHEAGILTMSVTGLPYAFILRNEDAEAGVNWDWVGDEGWGDTWFTNDSVLWSLEGIALLHKMNPEYGLGDLITNYRNNFVALQVKTHPTYPNIADSVLFYDRYKFDGSHIEDDPSLSTSGSALLWEVDKILGIVNTSLHEKILKTLFDTQKDTPDDLVMHGAYGWDAADPIALIEMKATGEIYLSPFAEYGASITEYEYSPDSGYSDNKLVFDGIDDKLQIPDLSLDSTKMSVMHDGKIYSYEDDKVVTVNKHSDGAKGLEVGRRNLLLNSGTSRKSSEYIVTEYPLSKEIEQGATVTVLFRARLGEGKSYFQLYNSGGHTSGNVVSINRKGEVGDYALYKATFDWRIPTSNTNEFLRIYHVSPSVIVESEISWIKLVEGNSITSDWTPAPEDFQTSSLSLSSLSNLQLYNRPLRKDELLHNAESKGLKELVDGVVVQDGLVLHYDFSHESNTSEYKDKAFDYSGNGNHGELQNFNFTEESGYEGEGLKFDGVDDYVEEIQPFYEKYTSNGIVYVEATISIPTTHRQTVVSAHYFNFDMAVEAGNRISFWFGDSEHRHNYQLLNGISLDWDYTKGTHVIGVLKDFQNNKVKFYVNGKEVQTYTLVEHDRDITFQPYPINIGKRSGVMNQLVDGNIHSAKVYLNRVLTPEEIAHNYAIEKEKFNIIEGEM